MKTAGDLDMNDPETVADDAKQLRPSQKHPIMRSNLIRTLS